VATVVYSARALSHLERAFKFLASENPGAAIAAAGAIRSAVENLAVHPLLGRRVHGDIRELVISYGQTGYIALYRFGHNRGPGGEDVTRCTSAAARR
jgi:plasmid stabilization system protein ParE